MRVGFILGVLTVQLILLVVALVEYFYLKARFKKYSRRLKIFSFLFKYYDVIHTLKSLEDNDNFLKAVERRHNIK